jgi:poly [ADP-ribose] polymerase
MGQFETLFSEKTGNRWGTKKFEKRPGKFYPLEIDYGGDDDTNALAEAGANSKLAPEVQQLIKMIFNVETMKKALLEFEVKKKCHETERIFFSNCEIFKKCLDFCYAIL